MPQMRHNRGVAPPSYGSPSLSWREWNQHQMDSRSESYEYDPPSYTQNYPQQQYPNAPPQSDRDRRMSSPAPHHERQSSHISRGSSHGLLSLSTMDSHKRYPSDYSSLYSFADRSPQQYSLPALPSSSPPLAHSQYDYDYDCNITLPWPQQSSPHSQPPLQSRTIRKGHSQQQYPTFPYQSSVSIRSPRQPRQQQEDEYQYEPVRRAPYMPTTTARKTAASPHCSLTNFSRAPMPPLHRTGGGGGGGNTNNDVPSTKDNVPQSMRGSSAPYHLDLPSIRVRFRPSSMLGQQQQQQQRTASDRKECDNPDLLRFQSPRALGRLSSTPTTTSSSSLLAPSESDHDAVDTSSPPPQPPMHGMVFPAGAVKLSPLSSARAAEQRKKDNLSLLAKVSFDMQDERKEGGKDKKKQANKQNNKGDDVTNGQSEISHNTEEKEPQTDQEEEFSKERNDKIATTTTPPLSEPTFETLPSTPKRSNISPTVAKLTRESLPLTPASILRPARHVRIAQVAPMSSISTSTRANTCTSQKHDREHQYKDRVSSDQGLYRWQPSAPYQEYHSPTLKYTSHNSVASISRHATNATASARPLPSLLPQDAPCSPNDHGGEWEYLQTPRRSGSPPQRQRASPNENNGGPRMLFSSPGQQPRQPSQPSPHQLQLPERVPAHEHRHQGVSWEQMPTQPRDRVPHPTSSSSIWRQPMHDRYHHEGPTLVERGSSHESVEDHMTSPYSPRRSRPYAPFRRESRLDYPYPHTRHRAGPPPPPPPQQDMWSPPGQPHATPQRYSARDFQPPVTPGHHDPHKSSSRGSEYVRYAYSTDTSSPTLHKSNHVASPGPTLCANEHAPSHHHGPRQQGGNDIAIPKRELSAALYQRAPYTYIQQPYLEGKPTLHKKFSWRQYPELERFLIANRDEYYRHSALNYTAKQKQYNNWLTKCLIDVATANNLQFDEKEFNFVAIRDRIRCYYKSYVQSARKRGLACRKQQQTADNPAVSTTTTEDGTAGSVTAISLGCDANRNKRQCLDK